MRRRAVLAAVGASLSLGGIAALGRRSGGLRGRGGWPEFAAGPENTGWNPRAPGPSGASVDWRRLAPDRWQRMPPVVAEGTVVAGTNEDPGAVYALDVESGDVRWSVVPEGEDYRGYVSRRIVGAPAIRDGTVYVGTHDWRVHALDLVDGSREWTRSLDGTVADRPLAVADDAVIVVGSTEVTALDAADGHRRWTHEFTSDEDVYPSAPAVADGRVFVATEHRLRSMDAATGGDVGVTTVTDETDSGIEGAPVVAGDLVLLPIQPGRLFAVDRRRGTIRWVVELAGEQCAGRPAVIGDRVVAASEPPICVDPVSHGEGDGDDDGDGGSEERPCRTGGVEAFDLRTGRRQWYADGLEPSGPPAVAGGTVYADDATDFVALEAASGDEAWRLGIDADAARVAIARDRLIATTPKAIVAIG